MILVLDNLKPDFNVGKLFRSAEVLSIREMYLINIGFFNVGPAKGGFRKVKSTFFDTFDSAYQELLKQEYRIFALSPKGDQLLNQAVLPKKSAFVVGHEEFGLSFDPAKYEKVECLKIPQFGETDSLNVSIAGTLTAYEYLRQNYLSPAQVSNHV